MSTPFSSRLSAGLCAQIACVLEVSAPKPGNVHRLRDFDDVRYVDFLLSAAAAAPALDRAVERTLGETILDAIERTRRVVATNTNLGIVLLLAPLAAAHAEDDLRAGVSRRLDSTTVTDADLVYRAIRLARPGGLGSVAEEDVAGSPTRPLRDVMALAAERDLVARQYRDRFADVLDLGVPALSAHLDGDGAVEDAVVACHLRLLATLGDSLIERKAGAATSGEASRRARAVLDAGWPRNERARALLDDLDRWLRSDGNRLNPGATADLTAASLFVALREGILRIPIRQGR